MYKTSKTKSSCVDYNPLGTLSETTWTCLQNIAGKKLCKIAAPNYLNGTIISSIGYCSDRRNFKFILSWAIKWRVVKTHTIIGGSFMHTVLTTSDIKNCWDDTLLKIGRNWKSESNKMYC